MSAVKNFLSLEVMNLDRFFWIVIGVSRWFNTQKLQVLES